MTSKTSNSTFQLLGFGILLAIVKLICSFLDPYNILDVIIFVSAGILFGKIVPRNRMLLGLLLALPACLLCLFFVFNIGYTSIKKGIGTSYAISLIVIPLSTIIGLFIHGKFKSDKKV